MFRKFCFYFSEITFKDSTCKANANIQNESKKEKRKKRKKCFLPSFLSFLSFPRLFVFHFRLYFIRSYIRTGFVSPVILPLLPPKYLFFINPFFLVFSVFSFIKFFLPDSCGNRIRF
jgi:hypothetical protein